MVLQQLFTTVDEYMSGHRSPVPRLDSDKALVVFRGPEVQDEDRSAGRDGLLCVCRPEPPGALLDLKQQCIPITRRTRTHNPDAKFALIPLMR